MTKDGDPKDPPQPPDAPDAPDTSGTPGTPGASDPTVVVETPGGGGRVVVQRQVPDTMFAFPLRRAVPFPTLMMPMLLDSPRDREIVAKAEAHNGHLFVVLQPAHLQILKGRPLETLERDETRAALARERLKAENN